MNEEISKNFASVIKEMKFSSRKLVSIVGYSLTIDHQLKIN